MQELELNYGNGLTIKHGSENISSITLPDENKYFGGTFSSSVMNGSTAYGYDELNASTNKIFFWIELVNPVTAITSGQY